jgi:hypothetical protein
MDWCLLVKRQICRISPDSAATFLRGHYNIKLKANACIIADDLHKPGWSLSWVSAFDLEGRTIWIADAHRGDGNRFVVRSDETLTVFLELESAICACGE